MSLTSYQTALPRNRGRVVYANWLIYARIADGECVRFLTRFDIGWLYLFFGLVLTTAAIVLPAHHDLDALLAKKEIIISNADDLAYRVEIYTTFLEDATSGDPAFQQRLIEMQFNQSPSGSPVVIDTSAPSTPLAWVAERAKRTKVVPMQTVQASLLSQFSEGEGRLWLLGFGVFALFVGLVSVPIRNDT